MEWNVMEQNGTIRCPILEVTIRGSRSKAREPMGSTSKITLRVNFDNSGVFLPEQISKPPRFTPLHIVRGLDSPRNLVRRSFNLKINFLFEY
jgi:hypothetical protein